MIAGVDWSTKRIDVAGIFQGSDDVVFTYRDLPKRRAVGDFDRARAVADALHLACHALERRAALESLSVVYIERPNGFGWFHMLPLLGALAAGTPRHVKGEWLLPNEWRAQHGIKGRRTEELKAQSRLKARAILDERFGFGEPLTDDQCEAFLIALAGEKLREEQR